MPSSHLSIAVVCSSNMNRSMEAHAFLSKKGFQVRSFGTGDKVKLPGTAPDKPNVYDFSCSYEEIYQDLNDKDKSFKTNHNVQIHHIGKQTYFKLYGKVLQILPAGKCPLLVLNIVLKSTVPKKRILQNVRMAAPANYHYFYTQNGLLHMLDRNKRIKVRPERFQQSKERFDIIVTCEERVYDQVVEYITNRMPTENASVHIINIDIQDNHEEATIGAFLICEMVTHMAKSDDLDNDIDEMLHQYENKCQRQLLHCVLFY